jgi:hypothetical protein
MGANSPMLGYRLFLNWIKLQRFFSRLPIHFLHCLGFKLRGLFPRLPSFFSKLTRLALRVPKLFPRLFTFFSSLHVLFPRFYPKLFRLFHRHP